MNDNDAPTRELFGRIGAATFVGGHMAFLDVWWGRDKEVPTMELAEYEVIPINTVAKLRAVCTLRNVPWPDDAPSRPDVLTHAPNVTHLRGGESPQKVDDTFLFLFKQFVDNIPEDIEKRHDRASQMAFVLAVIRARSNAAIDLIERGNA